MKANEVSFKEKVISSIKYKEDQNISAWKVLIVLAKLVILESILRGMGQKERARNQSLRL